MLFYIFRSITTRIFHQYNKKRNQCSQLKRIPPYTKRGHRQRAPMMWSPVVDSLTAQEHKPLHLCAMMMVLQPGRNMQINFLPSWLPHSHSTRRRWLLLRWRRSLTLRSFCGLILYFSFRSLSNFQPRLVVLKHRPCGMVITFHGCCANRIHRIDPPAGQRLMITLLVMRLLQPSVSQSASQSLTLVRSYWPHNTAGIIHWVSFLGTHAHRVGWINGDWGSSSGTVTFGNASRVDEEMCEEYRREYDSFTPSNRSSWTTVS